MDTNQELEEVVPNDSDPLLGREGKEAESSSVELSAPQPATVTPLEIEDEETNGSSAACCRICLEAESEIGDGLVCCLSSVFLCRLNYSFQFGNGLSVAKFLPIGSNKKKRIMITPLGFLLTLYCSPKTVLYTAFSCVSS